MNIAERNRLIKKVLKDAFKCNVTVRGSRGTAYGWVTVNIDHTPKNVENRRELERLVFKLFDANGIKIGTYGYDDPGSDYGYGSTIHLNFNRVADFENGHRS